MATATTTKPTKTIKKAEEPVKKEMTTICKECGKKIENPNYRRKFCSPECRLAYFQRVNNEKRRATIGTRIVKCRICGKEFEVTAKSQKRCCSKECFKQHWKQYNSQYIRERRKNDPEFANRLRARNTARQSQSYANKQWENWQSHADAILQLTQQENARLLIAKYLDVNFKNRKDDRRRKNYAEGEKEVLAELESLGDLRSE